jgi:cobalt-precorrin 5A hydrolase
MMTSMLAVGIGCRRGASADEIEHAVRAALDALACASDLAGTFAQIGRVASIDAKRDEAGLREFCARHAFDLRFFAADDIAKAASSLSPHARRHLGVDGVCEPCARLAGDGGALLVGKTIVGGVTVAIARLSLSNSA